ncbi:hypothetical protein HMPREF1860_01282 [Prevotella amnii]|jgi:hypothetical protein|uniref:Uncharacterized protein n=1 Tax=Prevotella amnii TaxID=419005 RepID=A0A134BCP8_9BACT|nr:hypothetical protein HMPREF1860_01282 [Prevotella amnii]
MQILRKTSAYLSPPSHAPPFLAGKVKKRKKKKKKSEKENIEKLRLSLSILL